MALRIAQLCTVTLVICLLASCGMPSTDSPLNLLADEGYNVLITIRPADIWNSDLMQELLDEVSDTSIERIHSDWEEAFGIRVDENIFLFGAIDLPRSLPGGRVRDAIFLGGGPIREEKIRDACTRLFGAEDFLERDHNGGPYYLMNPTRDAYPMAYAVTENVAIIGLEDSVTDSLDVLGGRKRSLGRADKYLRYGPLINEDADIIILIWDVTDLLEIGTALMRMQQRENLPADTADAINNLEAMGISVEFTNDLIITFRGRFEEATAAETVRAYIEESLNNLKQEEALSDLMILFAEVAEKEEDLLEIIEATEVFRDDSTVTIHQEIPGDSPILYNLRDAFFSAAEAKESTPGESTDQEEEYASPLHDIDSERQATTIMNMQRIGQMVETYIMDHPAVGCPKVANIRELAELLRSLDKNIPDEWLSDGWANELAYIAGSATDAKLYSLISYGSDGRPGPQPADPEITTKFEEDIIYSNGMFIQHPRGTQNRQQN